MIRQLSLIHFRRYKQAVLDLDQGVNFLEGVNNAGKTTLLYAIEYALFGRVAGFRSPSELMQSGQRDMGVQLVLTGNDGLEYVLQRIHVRPPRAKSTVHGHFTLSVIDGEDRRYVLSSDFQDHEQTLALTLYKLFGITRALFEIAVSTRQGTLSGILDGMPRLDQVLGVTAAVTLEKELRAKALEFEKTAAELPVMRQTLEHETERRKELRELVATGEAELKSLEDRETLETNKLTALDRDDAAVSEALEHAEAWRANVEGAAEARRDVERNERELNAWIENNGDEAALKKRAQAIKAPKPEDAKAIEAKRSKLEEDKSAIERSLGDLQGRVERLESTKDAAVCDQCGQPIDTARVAASLKDLRKGVQEKEKAYGLLQQEITKAAEEADAFDGQVRAAEKEREAVADGEAALAGLRNALKESQACVGDDSGSGFKTVESALAGLEDPPKFEQPDPAAVLSTLTQHQTDLKVKQAEARAALGNLAELKERIETQRRGAAESAAKSEREIARLEAVVTRYESQIVQAERLRTSSKVMKALQERLRESATTRLAESIQYLHAKLSGNAKEYKSVEVDAKDYRVLVKPAGMKSMVPAATHQGGGHRLMLGLAFKLAIAQIVGHKSFVLLDEPTDGLDQEHLASLMDQLEAAGVFDQMLIVTHHQASINARRIEVQRKGHQSLVEARPNDG